MPHNDNKVSKGKSGYVVSNSMVLGISGILALIIFGFIAVFNFNQIRLLQTSVITTQAIVTGKDYSVRRVEDDYGYWHEYTYTVRYEYRIPSSNADGRELHFGRQTVNRSIYERVSEGGTVDIIYSVKDPNVSRIEGTEKFDFSLLIGPLVGLGMIVAAIILRKK